MGLNEIDSLGHPVFSLAGPSSSQAGWIGGGAWLCHHLGVNLNARSQSRRHLPHMVDARRARTRAQGMLVLLIMTMHQNLKFPDF